ncbi:MAG: hypothetical protein H7301_04445 [Cryobacterium sp.]|nr:hypothetical protein [Oligoflexia bacterium]
MKTLLIRLLCGFAIGLSAGSAFASTAKRAPASAPEDAYLETETFVLKPDRVAGVNSAMLELGLSEDVDFTWVSKTSDVRVVNFVCYSVDCHHWAKKTLRTISKAPDRPEEVIGHQWRDASIDSKKTRQLTEDEKIKARQILHYTPARAG